MEYIYDVRFFTKSNNIFSIYKINIRAKNQKEAIGIARQMWQEKHRSYQFHISAKRRKDISLVEGLKVIGHFIHLDSGRYIPYTKTLNWNLLEPLCDY